MKERVFQLPHLNISAKVWGDESGIPVIACHGWLDNAATFDRIAPHLDGIYLIAIDFPGHGYSQHRPLGCYYHVWEYVFDVIAVVDYLELKTFNLLGHSMGGAVCTLVAGTVPERVEKFLAIEALGPGSQEGNTAPAKLRSSLLDFEFAHMKKSPVYASFDDAVKARTKGIVKLSEEAARIVVERGLAKNDEGYYWRTDPRIRLNSPVRFTEEQVRSFIENIKAPTRVLLGEDGFRKNNPEHYQTRVDSLINGQVDILPGGHHLHLESTFMPVADYAKQFFVS